MFYQAMRLIWKYMLLQLKSCREVHAITWSHDSNGDYTMANGYGKR